MMEGGEKRTEESPIKLLLWREGERVREGGKVGLVR